MPAKSYTGSYTGSGSRGSSRSRPPRRSLGGGEVARTRPRLLDRPWVSRLMVVALLALLLFGIMGVVVSCVILSGFAGLPELCLAQSFLFFACCLSLIYLALHLVAATRNLPVDRQRALQHPLQSWATVVARIALVFWVLSVIALPASFPKLDKKADVDLRPGHVDVVVCIFGFISMSIVIFIIEYSEAPFTLPRITPEQITCRLSALGVDEEAFEKSVSRQCSAERIFEKPGATETDLSQHPTAQERIQKAVSERQTKHAKLSATRDEKTSRVVSSPLGPRPMPSTVPELREPQTLMPSSAAPRPLRKPLPRVVMPEEPKPVHVGLQPEGWKTQWSELKNDTGITSESSTPTITPATSVSTRPYAQARAPSRDALRRQQNERITLRIPPPMPRSQPVRDSRYVGQQGRQLYPPKQTYSISQQSPSRPPGDGGVDRKSIPMRIHQNATSGLPGMCKTPAPMMAARVDQRPMVMPTGAVPSGHRGREVFEQAARRLRAEDIAAGRRDGLENSMDMRQSSIPRVPGGWD